MRYLVKAKNPMGYTWGAIRFPGDKEIILSSGQMRQSIMDNENLCVRVYPDDDAPLLRTDNDIAQEQYTDVFSEDPEPEETPEEKRKREFKERLAEGKRKAAEKRALAATAERG